MWHLRLTNQHILNVTHHTIQHYSNINSQLVTSTILILSSVYVTDLLLSQNIIAPVTTVTEWCAPIVVTPKKNSDHIRLCVDLSHLNKHMLRERFQSSTYHQSLKGYHQCPLDESSQLLTTFITPFGQCSNPYVYLAQVMPNFPTGSDCPTKIRTDGPDQT